MKWKLKATFKNRHKKPPVSRNRQRAELEHLVNLTDVNEEQPRDIVLSTILIISHIINKDIKSIPKDKKIG